MSDRRTRRAEVGSCCRGSWLGLPRLFLISGDQSEDPPSGFEGPRFGHWWRACIITRCASVILSHLQVRWVGDASPRSSPPIYLLAAQPCLRELLQNCLQFWIISESLVEGLGGLLERPRRNPCAWVCESSCLQATADSSRVWERKTKPEIDSSGFGRLSAH